MGGVCVFCGVGAPYDLSLCYVALIPIISAAHCRGGYYFCLETKGSKNSSRWKCFFAAQAITLQKLCSSIPYRTGQPQTFTPKAVPSAAFTRFLF
jgi:hypothetical protein